MEIDINNMFKAYKILNEGLKNGDFGNVIKTNIMANELKNTLMTELEKGCGKKVDNGGFCWYINTGPRRYCSSCKRKLKYLTEGK